MSAARPGEWVPGDRQETSRHSEGVAALHSHHYLYNAQATNLIRSIVPSVGSTGCQLTTQACVESPCHTLPYPGTGPWLTCSGARSLPQAALLALPIDGMVGLVGQHSGALGGRVEAP